MRVCMWRQTNQNENETGAHIRKQTNDRAGKRHDQEIKQEQVSQSQKQYTTLENTVCKEICDTRKQPVKTRKYIYM